MITQHNLKKVLSYNPLTGVFVWRKKLAHRIKIGGTAGSNHGGYTVIIINKHRYMAHVLAWVYIYGDVFIKQIDHINRNKSDNSIANLRNVSGQTNCMNKPKYKNNLSGNTGVYFRKDTKKWQAYIGHKGKTIKLGCFKNKLDAIASREKAQTELGFTVTHGS